MCCESSGTPISSLSHECILLGRLNRGICAHDQIPNINTFFGQGLKQFNDSARAAFPATFRHAQTALQVALYEYPRPITQDVTRDFNVCEFQRYLTIQTN